MWRNLGRFPLGNSWLAIPVNGACFFRVKHFVEQNVEDFRKLYARAAIIFQDNRGITTYNEKSLTPQNELHFINFQIPDGMPIFKLGFQRVDRELVEWRIEVESWNVPVRKDETAFYYPRRSSGMQFNQQVAPLKPQAEKLTQVFVRPIMEVIDNITSLVLPRRISQNGKYRTRQASQLMNVGDCRCYFDYLKDGEDYAQKTIDDSHHAFYLEPGGIVVLESDTISAIACCTDKGESTKIARSEIMFLPFEDDNFGQTPVVEPPTEEPPVTLDLDNGVTVQLDYSLPENEQGRWIVVTNVNGETFSANSSATKLQKANLPGGNTILAFNKLSQYWASTILADATTAPSWTEIDETQAVLWGWQL